MLVLQKRKELVEDRHRGPFPQDRSGQMDRVGQAPLLIQSHDLLKIGVDLDEALGVVLGAIGLLRRAGTGEVSDATEIGDRLSRLRGRRGGGRRRKKPSESRDDIAPLESQVVLLLWVAL